MYYLNICLQKYRLEHLKSCLLAVGGDLTRSPVFANTNYL